MESYELKACLLWQLKCFFFFFFEQLPCNGKDTSAGFLVFYVFQTEPFPLLWLQ